MTITASRLKEIRQEFGKLKPAKLTLDGNHSLTVKETIFALAPTLERMKKRGFDVREIVERLHEKGIDVKAPTLAKYLNEFRREKGRKKDTAPALSAAARVTAMATRAAAASESSQASFIVPDRPLGEL